MHNFWHRLNGLLTYAATVLAVLCLAISITGAPPAAPPPPLAAAAAARSPPHRIDAHADAFHSPPPPTVSVSNVAVESLQREGGHDRG